MLSHKNTKQHTQGIVVGGNKRKEPTKKPMPTDKKFVRSLKLQNRNGKIVLIVVITGLIFIGAVWWLSTAESRVSVYNLPESSPISTPLAQDESPIKDPVVELDDIKRKVDSYPKADLSKKQQIELATLYISLATAYTNNNDGYRALESYQEAESYATSDQMRAVLTGKGYAYIAIGDNVKAIESFEDVIVFLENNPSPFSQRDIDGYKRQIEELRGASS